MYIQRWTIAYKMYIIYTYFFLFCSSTELACALTTKKNMYKVCEIQKKNGMSGDFYIEQWIQLLKNYQSGSDVTYHQRRQNLNQNGIFPQRPRKRKWSQNMTPNQLKLYKAAKRRRLKKLGSVKSHKILNEDRPIDWTKDKARQQYIAEYPNSVINIKTFESYDQEKYCACSFIALLTMMKFYNKTFEGRWQNVWQSMQNNSRLDEGTEDIGSTLDIVVVGEILDITGIVYCPIRSSDNNELGIHPLIIHPQADQAKQTAQTTEDVIATIGQIIEGLIQSGRPVMINFDEHTRVAVAFNQTHILFADSWGDDYYRRTDGDYDIYSAGFSTVEKKNIYSFCRDICFYETSLYTEEIKEQKSCREEQKHCTEPQFKQHVVQPGEITKMK